MRPLRLDARDEQTTAKAVIEQQRQVREERTAKLRAQPLAAQKRRRTARATIVHDPSDLLNDKERQILLEMPLQELADLMQAMTTDMASIGYSADEIARGRDFV